MTKKKVSFDIDQKLLNDIKESCRVKGMKMADFFREASLEKLERDKLHLSILIPHDGTIDLFNVEKEHYDVDLFEASGTMKANVGAECEGVIRLKDGEKYDENDPLFQMLLKGKMGFYTTKKYC